MNILNFNFCWSIFLDITDLHGILAASLHFNFAVWMWFLNWRMTNYKCETYLKLYTKIEAQEKMNEFFCFCFRLQIFWVKRFAENGLFMFLPLHLQFKKKENSFTFD